MTTTTKGTILAPALIAGLLMLAAGMPTPAEAGTIGGGDAGRCERLASEATTTCTGKGKDRVCVTEDSYCGGSGSNGSCSCASGCEAAGNCCSDYGPVCAGQYQCTPDSGQIVFIHQGGMCSTLWDYAGDPDRLASTAGISNAVSVDVHAVQTDANGTQVAASTLVRYLDACCTGSNSCIVYNYSNGDNVVGLALDQMATTTRVCSGKGKNQTCTDELAWNILEVRTAAGNGGGSELSDWGSLADLFACSLAPHISPSTIRNLYDHNNTRGVPVYHMGGFVVDGDGDEH